MEAELNPWNEYRRKLWRLFIVLIVGAGCVCLSFITARLIPTDLFVPIVITLFAISVVSCLVTVSKFKCPRCGNPFFYTKYRRNGFAGKCLHCHLPKWTIPDNVKKVTPNQN